MNGFTARCIFACCPKFDFVVNLAPHCGHTCGFVSSYDEFLRFLELGEFSRGRGWGSGLGDVDTSCIWEGDEVV
jgi:hypothetical protein